MDDAPAETDVRRNALLRALPEQEFARVLQAGDLVQAEIRDEVYSDGKPIKDVYFPLTSVFSYVAGAGENTVEVGTIGPEGMVGLPAFLGATHIPHTAFCQIPGTALRVGVDGLQSLQVGDGALHRGLHRYTQALMVQIAQSVACNRSHSLEQRAARWLATTHDRVTADTFPLTQQFLAQMLGARRPTVSQTASALQSQGLISYRRGVLTVLDRDALVAAACECYWIVRDEFERLMGS